MSDHPATPPLDYAAASANPSGPSEDVVAVPGVHSMACMLILPSLAGLLALGSLTGRNGWSRESILIAACGTIPILSMLTALQSIDLLGRGRTGPILLLAAGSSSAALASAAGIGLVWCLMQSWGTSAVVCVLGLIYVAAWLTASGQAIAGAAALLRTSPATAHDAVQ